MPSIQKLQPSVGLYTSGGPFVTMTVLDRDGRTADVTILIHEAFGVAAHLDAVARSAASGTEMADLVMIES